ncbi:MAG: hypothetical protein ACI94Y_001996, partial [Maribacter sp.]
LSIWMVQMWFLQLAKARFLLLEYFTKAAWISSSFCFL